MTVTFGSVIFLEELFVHRQELRQRAVSDGIALCLAAGAGTPPSLPPPLRVVYRACVRACACAMVRACVRVGRELMMGCPCGCAGKVDMVTYLLGQGSDPNKAPQVVNSNLSGFSLFPPQQPQPQPQPTPGGGATTAAAGPAAAPLGQAPQQQQPRPRPSPDHDGTAQPPAEKRGHTALHYAAHNGHAGCVSLLLRYGADPNVRDGDGITPLHSASHNGKFESVLLLLHFEGDDDTIDDEGDEADDEEASEVREVGDLDAAHHGRRQEISEEREPTSVVKAKKPYARVRTHAHAPPHTHTHHRTRTRTRTTAHAHRERV